MAPDLFMMNTERSSKTRQATLTVLIVLTLLFNSVRCEMFCPPAVEGSSYNITAELYDLPSKNLTDLKAFWYTEGLLVADCNVIQCKFHHTLLEDLLHIQIQWFGDSDVQTSIGVPSFLALLQRTYTIVWTYGNTRITESCDVRIGNLIDECQTQAPCVNATDCLDLDAGYQCICTMGYSGQNCNEGDFVLRCNYSPYPIVFDQPANTCIDFNITCAVAGVQYGTDILLTYSLLSNNGSSVVQAQPRVLDNNVTVKLCISSNTPKGTYKIAYELRSARSKSHFLSTILPEVKENIINTVPVFNTPGSGMPYILHVQENAQPQGGIITTVYKSRSETCNGKSGCIQIIDSDAIPSIGIDSLNLTVTGTDVNHGLINESQQYSPIAYKSNITNEAFGYFFINGYLSTGRNITFDLMVTDGGQGKANAKVIFIITDVNNPPVCNLDAINVVLDILTQPIKTIATISCSDKDTNATLGSISYSIPDQYAGYFSVGADGTISMYTSVMELEPGLHNFIVTATGYSDTPDSAYVFQIPVNINLTAPQPTCKLTITSLPNRWTISIYSAVELKLECNTSGVDKLRVPSWNHVDIFDVRLLKESSIVYKIMLHLRQYRPATYDFEVKATLGGADSPASVILKVYNPPQFLFPFYTIAVIETASPGSTLLLIEAITDIPGAYLTYSLKNDGNGTPFLLQSNGSLSTAQQLLSLGGLILNITCEVQDSVSRLTATATVSITIVDTNEPPVCNQPEPITVKSDLPADSVITSISCQDPDKTPKFKSLAYTIYSEPVTVNLDIRRNGDVVLLQALPAGTTFILVTVNVSDISLVITVQFQIFVLVIKCPQEITESGLLFPETPVNSLIRVNCSDIYSGQISRSCYLNQTWGLFNYNNCSRKDLENTDQLIRNLITNTSQLSPKEVQAALNTIADNLADSLRNSSTIISGDIMQMMRILHNVGEITQLYDTVYLDKGTFKNFVSAFDVIIDADVDVWKSANNEEYEIGAMLLEALDNIAAASLRDEHPLDERPIVKENLVIKRASSRDGIFFPNRTEVSYGDHDGWVLQSSSTVFLSKNAFGNTNDDVKYSVVLYRNVTEKFQINQKLQNGTLSGKVLNSDIVSLTINKSVDTLSPPLLLSFSIYKDDFSNPSCGYLDTNARVDGVWATQGCTAEILDGAIQCSCNHLTNFAVLMNPYGKISEKDRTILSIISIVGCSISIFCLVITVIVYLSLWKYLHCDRASLHVHLSVCLILAYIVFLAGVDRTENEIACKVVAVLLHYLFLTVFFIMLSEGIEVFKSVSFVFSSYSILYKLLALSYGVPVIIVAVSLGVTKTDGYGSETTCWLTIKGGLIWAFVGPALFVILINFIILIRVLRIMQTSRHMYTKSVKQRTKSVVRTLCILSPLLGITWVCGVLSVNEDTIVFQYLFAIFNSLQGLSIFICYCVLTHQVQDGFRAKRRKESARSFATSQRIVLSSSSCDKYSDSKIDSHKHKKNSNSDFNSTSISHVTDTHESASFNNRNDQHYERQHSGDSSKVQHQNTENSHFHQPAKIISPQNSSAGFHGSWINSSKASTNQVYDNGLLSFGRGDSNL